MDRREPVEPLRDWLVAELAALTGRPAAEIDPTQTFAGNGLDSVKVARLAERLQEQLGRPVDPTVLFEHPTVANLVAHLADPAAGRNPAGRSGSPSAGEPVAVVGLACRLPGAPDALAFWQLLLAGTDAVGPVPEGRWPAAGSGVEGGFLPDIAGFDASFFRISADEADRMDPQQRLLLEVCWEAVEDAGDRPVSLRGSRTGVFVGISTNDYAHRQLAEPDLINRHTATGNALAVAANRLSYVFDWHGPSLAVDTACSSSLVAVHLAVRALRSGECDRAVAGGVNLLVEPDLSRGLNEAGMLAPDGRCKPFAAAADGYGRGEGCGVLVLKRLADARAAGDRVYAVIRGSAVNQDGGSNGLTAPNPAAQRAVLRDAYADAGLAPHAARYVECHGTGTPLGDPIEARSLAEARSGDGAADRVAPTCLIGSVKSNLGHLEAAAGVAGLIKTVLALHHGVIPPTLHAIDPNPRIPFAELNLGLVTEATPWPDGQRCAGVSGFGFGGTNAHVVLAADPIPTDDGAAAGDGPGHPGPLVVPLSARSRTGLARLARATARHAAGTGPAERAALGATRALRREHHRPYRDAVVVEDPAGLPAALDALADRLDTVGEWPAASAAPQVGFVFSGQGGQWVGMGRELLVAESLFRSVIRRCDEAVAGRLGWSIEAALTGDEYVDPDDTAVAQVLIVAVQLGMAQLWRSLGVTPAAVVGHSVGEISAAVVAGALSLETGLRLAVHRGRAMGRTSGPGGMLAVGLSETEATRRFADRVDVAAVNAPEQVVLAGDPQTLDQIAVRLVEEGRYASRLPVRYAFHSRHLEAAAAELTVELKDACPELADLPDVDPGTVGFHSTVLGRRTAPAELTAGYWGTGVRAPVRFADAVASARAAGVDVLLEIGPRPVLRSALRHGTQGDGVAVLSTVTSTEGQRLDLLRAAATLYRLGVPVDWRHVYPDDLPVVSAPGHPWDHVRHWLDRSPVGDTVGRRPAAGDSLLGEPVDLADSDTTRIWQRDLSVGTLPYLDDHRVAGVAVFPAAGYLELFTLAAEQTGGGWAPTDVRFLRPLVVDGPVRVQCRLDRDDDGWTATVHARPAGQRGGWQRHATATLRPADPAPDAPDLDAVRDRCPEHLPAGALYAALSARGLDYGPLFRGVQRVRAGEREAFGELAVPDDAAGSARLRLLDAALHVVAATGAAGGVGGGTPILPVAVAAVSWWSTGTLPDQAQITLHPDASGALLADVLLLGGGVPVGGLRGLRLSRTETTAVARDTDGLRHYRLDWRPATGPDTPTAAGRWLVLAPPDGPGRELAERLATVAGDEVLVCHPAGGAAVDGPLLDPTDPQQYQRLLDRGDLAGVLHLLGAGDPARVVDPARAALPVTSALYLLRAVSYGIAATPPRVVFATHGAQPVAGRPVLDPLGAGLWGLAKTVPFEHPLLDITCVDLDPAGDPVAALRAELAATTADAEVGYAGTGRYVRRIVPDSPPPPARLALDPEAVYLVTGGTGALGLQVARRLAERGAAHLVLLSRGGDDAGVPDVLRRVCPDVTVLRADVADRAALAGALDRVRATGRPLRGVVHAAGVLHNGALLDMTPDAVAAALAPKVRGGWHLHELTAGDPLDLFVCFASAAGVLGSPGQANYAAANASLDALAHLRQSAGRPAVALDWGPWADAGMAADWDSAGDHELRTAASAIPPPVGLDAFEALAAGPRVQPVVLPFDLRDLVQFYPSEVGRSFLAEVTNAEAEALRSIGTGFSARPELSSTYVAPRDEVERRIVAIWQKSLGIEPIGVLDSFFELGGDSVMGNQILVETNRALGVQIRPETAFGDFTVANHAQLAEAAMVAMLDELSEDEVARLLGD